jgi:hypothetical protein
MPTFWQDAIKKEMKVIIPALKILDEGATAPVGFQQIPCHIVFDVKINFTCKAHFVETLLTLLLLKPMPA